MKKIKYISLLAICTAIGCLYFVFADSAQETANAQNKNEKPKYALLIGVNQYKDYGSKKVRDLNGTNNDVNLISELLIKNYKYSKVRSPNSPIITLENQLATQENIRKYFKEYLIKYAKEYKDTAKIEPKDGATIIFYYSGHGSKVADQPNGDEIDGIDETIVPHDSDTDGSKDIRDDEFDGWINELKDYTTNITLIFDSCHSGTIARGGVSKSVRRDVVPTNNAKGDGMPRDGMMRNETYVAVSGSLPKEESQEDEFIDIETNKKKWNGALTWSFVNLLKRNPNITYRELMRQVQSQVLSMDKNQTPQVEGDIDRQVFGASSSDRQPVPIFIEESKVVKKNIDKEKPNELVDAHEIKMKVGSIVGAGYGAAIAVFRKAEDGKLQQIGSGIIIDPTTEFNSTGEVDLTDEAVKAGLKEIPKDAFVQIVSPSFSRGEKRIVALDATEAQILESIEKRLKDNSMLKTERSKNLLAGLTLTRGKSSTEVSAVVGEWDFAVVRATYKEFVENNKQTKTVTSDKGNAPECAQKRFYGLKPTDGEQGFFISNRLGQPLYNLWYSAGDAEAAKCLATALDKIARIESLRNLNSSGSGLNDGLKVELVRLKSFSLVTERPVKCKSEEVSEEERKKDQTAIPRFKPDDKYYMKVTNNTDQNLHIYIYTLTTDGRISLLFPMKGETTSASGIVPKNGGTVSTIQQLAPGGCGAFVIEPLDISPAGFETLKIIASTNEFPAEMLEQPTIAMGQRKGGISQLFRQTAVGARTGTMKFSVSDWTAKNFDIEIIE